MDALRKSFSQKFIYILAFILCTQQAVAELNGAYSPIHETIGEFEAEQKIDELLLLIQKRLVIMHEVARTKWNQNLPIEDKIREQQILVELTAKANQYGLDEKLITQFFQAQIDASKEIQKRDFLLWKERGILKFEKVFSLKNELRFYIDRLNNEMLMLLSKIYTNPYDLHDKYILIYPISKRSSDYIENDIWSLAVSPLMIGSGLQNCKPNPDHQIAKDVARPSRPGNRDPES
jgi:chorismate mutase